MTQSHSATWAPQMTPALLHRPVEPAPVRSALHRHFVEERSSIPPLQQNIPATDATVARERRGRMQSHFSETAGQGVLGMNHGVAGVATASISSSSAATATLAGMVALSPLAIGQLSRRARCSTRHRARRRQTWCAAVGQPVATQRGEVAVEQPMVVTDMLAKSFISHFNNDFLNTIEKVRTPHLQRVVDNLNDFAARVPPKYRTSIQKALRTDGFLSFLLSRASLSLLCAKASTVRDPGSPPLPLRKEHEELATVVEELYIAAMLHAEEQWDMELKADGKTFMAVATSFVKNLATPGDPMPLTSQNIQSALVGFDANPRIWTKYGLDLLGISFDLSVKSMLGSSPNRSSPETGQTQHPTQSSASSQLLSSASGCQDDRKVSLLGGDSLYATAQWAMANLDSRACRKLIAKTIAEYSDGQLRKRELVWNTSVSIRQYLELEKVAGVAAFFGASSACAALVNDVDDEISHQLAEFGSDVGLIIGLLKDTRTVGIQSALKLGRISAPIIFALQQDPDLCEMFERKLSKDGDREEAARRIKAHGMAETMRLVKRLGFRAAARLECLEESSEKEALLTLTRGIACLPLSQTLEKDAAETGHLAPDVDLEAAEHRESSLLSKRFDLKIENLKLRAQLQRLRSSEMQARKRIEALRDIASGREPVRQSPERKRGLGLQLDAQEIDWLLLRGLERRTPLPDKLDLESLLSCITIEQAEVQKRLLNLSECAKSHQLKHAIREVFSAGGKRLRPALCLLVHRMLMEGSRGWQAVPMNDRVIKLAMAVEIIHTASLVHDDILDDADTRRQKQAMHRIFGPDVAVLSGDFLFAHASSMVESLENDQVTRLVSLVIEEFGYGELSQSAQRFDVDVTLFDYMKKSFYKTASLLAASCRSVAVLSGPPCEVCDVLYSYGFYLGIAFQIADDILDFTATDEELGKPSCQDLREGNLTAPVILCLQGNKDLGLSPAPGAPELARLIRRRFSADGDLERAVQLIHEGNGIEMAYRLADQMANKALEALMLVAPADTEARRALAGIARWAVRRSK